MTETVLHHDHHRCQEFLERLSMYLDDELAKTDRQTIETHLRDCPCCEDVFESLKQTVTLCHEEGKPDLPDDVRLRARTRVTELLQRARSKPHRRA
jgi:anti-sigma factor RsiW